MSSSELDSVIYKREKVILALQPLRHRKLTFLLLNKTCLVLANSVDPDQLASEEANWSGSPCH